MKKILLLISIILIISLGTWFFLKNKPLNNPIEETSLLDLILSAEIKIPDLDQKVTLTNGQASFPIAPDSIISGQIILDQDLTLEYKDNLIAPFLLNTGGTGVFTYLSIFRKENNSLIKLSDTFLGDRIGLLNLTPSESNDQNVDYLLTINLLVRQPNEPFVIPPSIPTQKIFSVQDGSLKESVKPADNF